MTSKTGSLNLSTASERTLSEWMSSVRSQLESSPPVSPTLSQNGFEGSQQAVGENEMCFGRKTGRLVGEVLKVQLKGHASGNQKRVRVASGFFEEQQAPSPASH